ncbi:MAG TPA: DUF4142 domain-containing protein [Thermoanaerobaculia bacterium]
MLLLMAGCATTDPMGPVMPGAQPETDIAAIMAAANEGEIQQGQAARTRAQSADVRAFADQMVTDHTNALNQGRDLFGRIGVTPADNTTSSTLRANSQRTVTNLGTYNGQDFDRTYIRSQIDLHQWLLSTLDTALIPSARNAELRTFLEQQRATVAAHLEHARRLQR